MVATLYTVNQSDLHSDLNKKSDFFCKNHYFYQPCLQTWTLAPHCSVWKICFQLDLKTALLKRLMKKCTQFSRECDVPKFAH